ncbi:prion-inhibition and propagation-domain-containing protein, partial [Lasiosphaeria ovina]
GLSLGLAGVAGLFSACLECYQLVQRGATMQKDTVILITKFENQELRFTAWGRARVLFGPEECDPRLDEPQLGVRVFATLKCIKSLFEDERNLNRRYGLRQSSDTSSGLLPASKSTAMATSLMKQSQRFTLLNKAQWEIADREKFAELIQHLKDFNDDLETMTRATDVPRRQRIIVEYEIEEVDDVEVLEEMVMASEDDSDVVSDTASIRLERIREGSIRTVSARTATNSNSSASSVTARSSLSLSIDEVVMDFQYGCVAVGDSGTHVTDLLTVFTLGYFSTLYTPCDGQAAELTLWDLSGQQDYPQLRKVSYDWTDVVLICYSSGQSTEISAQSVERLLDDVATNCPEAPITVVGVIYPSDDAQMEASTNIRREQDRGIRATAERGGGRIAGHILCNVHTGEGVDNVFEIVRLPYLPYLLLVSVLDSS